jgi:hypothetical protein
LGDRVIRLLAIFLVVVATQVAAAWEGPPANVAAGLLGPAMPTNYIDGSTLGTIDPSPYTESRGRINFVLLQDPIDSLQTTIKVQQNTFPQGYIFYSDPNQTAVPIQLTDIDLSVTYKHKLEDGNDWALLVNGGSDSDIPFNSIFEVDWGVTGTYHLKVDQLHSWIFFLNFSPTRSFLPGVPLPGAGYLIINPENHTQIFIGIPFFIAWQPDSKWNLSLSYFIATVIDAEASRKLNDSGLKAHFNFQWSNELWLIANRADNQQHLIFDEKKVVAGLKSPLGENFFGDLIGGFIFDQTLLLGHSITSSNMPNITLPVGIFAQANLAYRF